jgi:anti-sigma B factor antagonist
MPATPFDASVRRRGDSVVIDLAGDINGEAKPRLDAAYTEALAFAPDRVLLNFAAVEYINSTGIAVVVSLLARARADHREIVAFGLDDHYREIFSITRLSDFMALFPDEDSAVGEYPTPAI